MTNKEFYIWFAGFIDGEGCVMVTTIMKKHIRIRLSISNTHKPTMDLIYKKFSGNRSLQDRNKYRNNNKYYRIKKYALKRTGIYKWRRSFRLSWNNESARKILKLVYPYLITKKEQAKLALSIKFDRPRYNLNDLEKKRRFLVMDKVKQLNRKEYE